MFSWHCFMCGESRHTQKIGTFSQRRPLPCKHISFLILMHPTHYHDNVVKYSMAAIVRGPAKTTTQECQFKWVVCPFCLFKFCAVRWSRGGCSRWPRYDRLDESKPQKGLLFFLCLCTLLIPNLRYEWRNAWPEWSSLLPVDTLAEPWRCFWSALRHSSCLV